MRILEVILKPAIGGAETLVAELASEFEEAGHAVDVVALDLPASREDGDVLDLLMHRHVPSLVASRGPRLPRQAVRAISAIAWLGRRRRDYDVLHAHTLIPNAYIRLAAAATFCRLPVVITLHSGSNDFVATRVKLAERALSPWTSAVVAVNSTLAHAYARLVPSLSGRVQVIPNGINPRIAPRPSRSDLPHRFIATCRVTPGKDIATMLRGFALFRSSCDRQVELHIAGPLPDVGYAGDLTALASQLGLGGAVSFLSSRSDIPQLLAEADVFLHSSLAESYGLSVLEAATAGIPMVVADLDSIRSMLGEVPVYFTPGDPHSLANALQLLDSSWHSRTLIASAAAPDVKRRYSMADCANAYLGLFTSIGRAS